MMFYQMSFPNNQCIPHEEGNMIYMNDLILSGDLPLYLLELK